jgi:hypothetical protein
MSWTCGAAGRQVTGKQKQALRGFVAHRTMSPAPGHHRKRSPALQMKPIWTSPASALAIDSNPGAQAGLTLDEMALEVGRRTAERLRDSLAAMFPQMEC